MSFSTTYIFCVRACCGLERSNEHNSIRIPFSFRGKPRCRSLGRPALKPRNRKRVIHPSLEKSLPGAISRPNRALPTPIAGVPGSRITNRNDNHAHWIAKPDGLKKLQYAASVTFAATVQYARARARGFEWLHCEPRVAPKTHTARPIPMRFEKRSKSTTGLLCPHRLSLPDDNRKAL